MERNAELTYLKWLCIALLLSSNNMFAMSPQRAQLLAPAAKKMRMLVVAQLHELPEVGQAPQSPAALNQLAKQFKPLPLTKRVLCKFPYM